ncbi:MAG: ROK family protein [Anaerolineae bacterium]|nr:MAG: ROK family protein [Anaerolineae bacterium]
MHRWVIGVDLGGTLIRAVRTDLEGEKVARSQLPTEAESGSEAVVERINTAIEEVMRDVEPDDVLGIGIGAPGPIDADGRIYDPPNLPDWGDFSLTKRILDRFERPAFAGNDANLAALGEHRFGAGQGVDDMVYMTVSTGIGGGIISGGRLLLGARGYAAEIGHQTLIAGGPICGCGQPGHLEALASGPSIVRNAKERLEAGANSSIADFGPEITGESITEAAKAGDELARELFKQAGFYIGLGLVNLIHILEPKRVLIGGGVSLAGDLLFEPIRETVYQRVMSPIYRDVEILPAALGADVGLMGAVALVLYGSD